jgi:AbrB family looped-hinge helix DNA binding protein
MSLTTADVNEQAEIPEVTASVWTKLGEGGRLVIPAEIRKMLGLSVGDSVLLRVEDGELHVITSEQAWNRAQGIVRRFVPPGESLVEELIADRRGEAARE